MITLKDFMELIEYRITEGYEYQWTCYGPDAFALDSWNHQQDGYSAGIMFDTKTHTVYEVSICDYKRGRAYRIINPDYKQAHRDESISKSVLANQAWDDVNYIDLETDGDFVAKTKAIINDQDYDTRIELPMEMPDDVLYQLMVIAHEKDLTLNQLIENVIREQIERLQTAESLDAIRSEYEATEEKSSASMSKPNKSKKKNK